MSTVQTFGRKKTATARAVVSQGTGVLRINNAPLETLRPELLRDKVTEALVLIGEEQMSKLNIKIFVTGGGYVSQIYAVRQAIAKGVLAYLQKFDKEMVKEALKSKIVAFDRQLLVADHRRPEMKKPGRKGPRAGFQKSYR